jgi:hypothetical protein
MVLTLAAIILVLLILMTLLALARLSSERRDCTPLSLDVPSAEQYDGGLWLLADERLLLLRSHGAHEHERRIRLRRLHVVRQRLKSLNQQFRQVGMALKTILVQSERDRPELASRLIRAQIRFSVQMLVVRFRLLRYGWGFSPRSQNRNSAIQRQ